MSSKLNTIKEKYKSVYFIGIKGVGMTALAILLKEMGIQVSGSDVPDVFQTDQILRQHKIPVVTPFETSNVPPNADLVIATGAHGGLSNPESIQAQKLGLQVIMHGKALGMIMDLTYGISIAGCHGKTTTSAMIAYLLQHAHRDPSYAIGCASINGLGAGGHFGKGKHFIAEADEYITSPGSDITPRFFWQNPRIAVMTNIEYDHPDAYKSIDEVENAFLQFANKIPKNGLLVAGTDNKSVQKVLAKLTPSIPRLTYGFSPKANYRIINIKLSSYRTTFNLIHHNLLLGEFALSIPGLHNILNATGAIIVSKYLGLNISDITEGLKLFSGTKRRFEKIGERGSILLFDDYAHHPSEIIATLKGAAQWFPHQRIIVIFQPHTYSRTQAFLADFSKAFHQSPNITLITDIFASAREKVNNTINSPDLVKAIKKYKSDAYYVPQKDDCIHFLSQNIKPNDVIITLGAGDIYLWHSAILREMEKQHG